MCEEGGILIPHVRLLTLALCLLMLLAPHAAAAPPYTRGNADGACYERGAPAHGCVAIGTVDTATGEVLLAHVAGVGQHWQYASSSAWVGISSSLPTGATRVIVEARIQLLSASADRADTNVGASLHYARAAASLAVRQPGCGGEGATCVAGYDDVVLFEGEGAQQASPGEVVLRFEVVDSTGLPTHDLEVSVHLGLVTLAGPLEVDRSEMHAVVSDIQVTAQ